MEYRKKLKTRLHLGIIYLCIGVILAVSANAAHVDNDFLSTLGIVLAVMGIARICRYFVITESEESIRKQQIVETDERNLAIVNRARSCAFIIYVTAAACGTIVFTLWGKDMYGTILGLSMFALVFLYWISYWILQKRS